MMAHRRGLRAAWLCYSCIQFVVAVDNTSMALRLMMPKANSEIPDDFRCEFVLPVGAATGTLRMSFTQTSGAPDPFSPHEVTFSEVVESAGRHRFIFTELSMAAQRMPQVTAVRSRFGEPQDLVRNAIYRVDFSFRPDQTTSMYIGPTHVVARDVDRTDSWWLYGIAASVVGSMGVASGGVLQKSAHVHDGLKPLNERSRKLFGACVVNWHWLMGFLLSAILPIPFAMLSLAWAGQSLVMPLTGVSVVFNQVLAPCFLGEKLTRIDAGATVLIVFGIGLSSAFGVHSSSTYSLDQLVQLWKRPAHLITTACITLIAIGSYVGILLRERSLRYARESGHHISLEGHASLPLLQSESRRMGQSSRKSLLVNLQPMFFASLCGASGSFTNLFLKGLVEVIEDLISGVVQVFDPLPLCIFTTCTLFFAVSQVIWINKGLARFDAIKFLPAYSAALALLGSLTGVVYFEEYKHLSSIGAILWLSGALVVVLGILILLLNSDKSVPKERGEVEVR
eukprot:TRINITY_DN19761_c0_g2_i1.p1 TRINITY_DN19761_c0_g2~~TRINITY_DN19761_c0_g2_i1.p1  ORF type:complete len:509 (-),score=49.98 TRINITY_DN19761_c0_g2_i1:29-1555(-)